MTKSRIAELKEEINQLRKGCRKLDSWDYPCSVAHGYCSECILKMSKLEAELSGRQEQEKEDNKKFADWLKELTECGVNGDARRLVERKFRELEGE